MRLFPLLVHQSASRHYIEEKQRNRYSEKDKMKPGRKTDLKGFRKQRDMLIFFG